MTKDELEIKISRLQNLVIQKNEELTDYATQIERLNDELKDLNKPKLTGEQMDAICYAIEVAVGDFDFDHTDNYEVDFNIDYNNRIAIENLNFHNADDLVREVYNQVINLFAEVKENTDEL